MKIKPGAIFLLMVGLGLIGLAVFANRMGIDPTPEWGHGRIAFLALGVTAIALAWAYCRFSEKPLEATARLKSYIRDHPWSVWWQNQPAARTLGSLRALPGYFLTGLSVLIVLAVYIWFISVGRWTVWPKGAVNYYNQLADSFQNGHLYLDLAPDPALQALPNPYEFEARKGINIPIDVSYYRGKFYLYWGPVPAFLLVILKPFIPGEPGDQHLAFLFITGTYLFHVLILWMVWKRFFLNLPVGLVAAGILVAGLTGPATWMLNDPITYEVAAAGGQFFFIGGLFFALVARTKNYEARFLIAAGIFWACAVGTRPTQLLPAGFMAALILADLVKTFPPARALARMLNTTAALILPCLVGLLGIGWYNWARFGSVLEFGLHYQLKGEGGPDLKYFFLPAYLPQNIFNYLFNPFHLRGLFPYLKPLDARKTSVFTICPLPGTYHAEEKITGLLQSAPFLIFAGMIVLVFAVGMIRRIGVPRKPDFANPARVTLDWIFLSLAGSFTAGFLPVSIYFWPAMRYATDFFSPLCLLAIIGFWQIHSWLDSVPAARWFNLAVGLGLLIYSVSVNTVLAFSYKLVRFSTVNPALLEQLKNLLGG